MFKTLALLLTALSFSVPCLAQVSPGSFTMLTQLVSPTGAPQMVRNMRLCREIFSAAKGKAHMTFVQFGRPADSNQLNLNFDAKEMGSELGLGVDILTVDALKPHEVHQRFFESGIEQWVGQGTARANQAAVMRYVQKKLPNYRQQWLRFEFGDVDLPGEVVPDYAKGVALVRIMDASEPMVRVSNIKMWHREGYETTAKGTFVDALTPIELTPANREVGYELPFRTGDPAKPLHMWHLGMGSNIKAFKNGTKMIMSHVGQLLDLHYNGNYLQTFNSVRPLQDLDMILVSSAKPELVDYWRDIGFTPRDPQTGKEVESTVIVDSKGEAQVRTDIYPRLPDGMVLVAVKASEFMRLVYSKDTDMSFKIPELNFESNPHGDRGVEPRFVERNIKVHSKYKRIRTKTQLESNVSEMIRRYQVWGLHMKKLLENDAFVIQEMQSQKLEKGNEALLNYPDYQKAMTLQRSFAELFFQTVRGTEPHLRSADWPFLEIWARGMLTEYPITSFMEMNGKPELNIDVAIAAFRQALTQ